MVPDLHQVSTLSTETSMHPIPANLPSTLVQLPPATAKNVARCVKGTCMRPTKSTTARHEMGIFLPCTYHSPPFNQGISVHWNGLRITLKVPQMSSRFIITTFLMSRSRSSFILISHFYMLLLASQVWEGKLKAAPWNHRYSGMG